MEEINYREQKLAPGLPMCQGCGLEFLLRVIYDTLGDNFIDFGGPGCCLRYGRSSVPFYGTLFTNMASTASGVSRELIRQGKENITCLCLGGDGMCSDIALGPLSAAAERGEHLLFICYDNEAYMNTGIQRSSRTPLGGWTNTTPIGNSIQGKKNGQKPLSIIMAEHNIEYAGTASLAYLKDLRTKLTKGREAAKKGFVFLHILAPCPTGWKCKPDLMIEVSRAAVQTNYFPLWECEHCNYNMTQVIKDPKPITEFTRLQRRFSHLSPEQTAALQEAVDTNYAHLQKLCK